MLILETDRLSLNENLFTISVAKDCLRLTNSWVIEEQYL